MPGASSFAAIVPVLPCTGYIHTLPAPLRVLYPTIIGVYYVKDPKRRDVLLELLLRACLPAADCASRRPQRAIPAAQRTRYRRCVTRTSRPSSGACQSLPHSPRRLTTAYTWYRQPSAASLSRPRSVPTSTALARSSSTLSQHLNSSTDLHPVAPYHARAVLGFARVIWLADNSESEAFEALVYVLDGHLTPPARPLRAELYAMLLPALARPVQNADAPQRLLLTVLELLHYELLRFILSRGRPAPSLRWLKTAQKCISPRSDRRWLCLERTKRDPSVTIPPTVV
jgi:hypothetical protein